MIEIKNIDVYGWEAAIRGMRNPMNSWEKSDSYWARGVFTPSDMSYVLGNNDLTLMKRLIKAGTDHSKFMRMINVSMDIKAPLYWWKEFDTYKVGTVRNSCSTMHKIAEKEFTLDDFSCEHLINHFDETTVPPELLPDTFAAIDVEGHPCYYTPKYFIKMTCDILNYFRKLFLETKDKKYWWQMIQLLPSSYNQTATVQLNYQVLRNIYHARINHKLDEWQRFCVCIAGLPCSELITMKKEKSNE